MRFDVLTVFPQMFEAVLGDSIIGRARENKILEMNCIDIRDFSTKFWQSSVLCSACFKIPHFKHPLPLKCEFGVCQNSPCSGHIIQTFVLLFT